MKKHLSKQLGSTLAHIQDLFDTVIYQTLFNSYKNQNNNSLFKNITNIGKSYYKTYSKIKKRNN